MSNIDQSPPGAPPAPSIDLVFHIYAMQAFMAMGLAPNPMTGKTSVDLPSAKFAIDMLEILEAKTKGNLNPDEARSLGGIMHQARLAFVEAKGKAGK